MTAYQWMISHGKNNNVMWLILNGENFTGQLSLALSDSFIAMILNWLDCISPFTTQAIKWNVAVVVLHRLFSYGGVQSGTKGRSRPDYSSWYLPPRQWLLSERWILHTWNSWEGSRESRDWRASHLVSSQVFIFTPTLYRCLFIHFPGILT